jgi:polyisoprenoid-binding protein YceI
MKRVFLFLSLVAVTVSSPAFAQPWVTDYTKSHISFSGSQGDQKFRGIFRKFQITINFDPAKPEAGDIKATIDITSVLTGTAELDSYLPQPDWFGIKQFPKAEFASTIIKADSTPSCYQATGTLTLKGISKEIQLPFCLTKEGDHMRAKGTITLLRNDFHIGAGQWADNDVVTGVRQLAEQIQLDRVFFV